MQRHSVSLYSIFITTTQYLKSLGQSHSGIDASNGMSFVTTSASQGIEREKRKSDPTLFDNKRSRTRDTRSFRWEILPAEIIQLITSFLSLQPLLHLSCTNSILRSVAWPSYLKRKYGELILNSNMTMSKLLANPSWTHHTRSLAICDHIYGSPCLSNRMKALEIQSTATTDRWLNTNDFRVLEHFRRNFPNLRTLELDDVHSPKLLESFKGRHLDKFSIRLDISTPEQALLFEKPIINMMTKQLTELSLALPNSLAASIGPHINSCTSLQSLSIEFNWLEAVADHRWESLTSLEVTDLFEFSRTNPSSIESHLARFASHHPGIKNLQWALDHLPIGDSFHSLESVSLWTESNEALDAVIQPMTNGRQRPIQTLSLEVYRLGRPISNHIRNITSLREVRVNIVAAQRLFSSHRRWTADETMSEWIPTALARDWFNANPVLNTFICSFVGLEVVVVVTREPRDVLVYQHDRKTQARKMKWKPVTREGGLMDIVFDREDEMMFKTLGPRKKSRPGTRKLRTI
ncbi:hypothetical protein PROFUN_05237 [Planoprotostelium fungivorum]|uniref:F-box domain-containing protein n=1 Tax=Planoprotostelium fungivorum TaxID=1890364 RepID=A0A2P6NRK2_9EUKA|nr:hypothetical protein PROFUN_05237 [Planoprotostelium fungivorum]